jgi:hypothetical protein
VLSLLNFDTPEVPEGKTRKGEKKIQNGGHHS